MHCPFCSTTDTKVIDSRLVADGGQVRRRRECLSCKERFTTFESAELVMPRVVKQERELEAIKIGEEVMHELRRLDEVAYVRFASVYRSFQDINEFKEEVERLSRSAPRSDHSLSDHNKPD